jgi:uncharacterized protein (DUF433 family)
LKGRWEAGESVDEIAEDFCLSKDYVTEAFSFEVVQENELGRKDAWIN